MNLEIIYLFNGLGNQMSQYAFYLSKKNKNKNTYYFYNLDSSSNHNGYELEKVFDIKLGRGNKFFFYIHKVLFASRYFFFRSINCLVRKIFDVKIIQENINYDFNPNLLTSKRGINLYLGGWHSEKYFLREEKEIRRTFKFNLERLNSYSLSILSKIENSNSVSIHVRRGDYLNEENYNTFGCVTNLDYYTNAINLLRERVENPLFFVFTNDYDWVLEHFNSYDFLIVNGNKSEDSWMDMFLISQCKHNINANSTFSWWGAWLNVNKHKIVVCPKEFVHNVVTKDFYPEEWIKL